VQPGGPAARAGIKSGEVITAIGGQPVSSAADVSDLLATLRPGQTVSVSLATARGSRVTLKVTLGQYPGSGK
jgi:S1-C subfamily serine protease